jgi:hypothetical protein
LPKAVRAESVLQRQLPQVGAIPLVVGIGEEARLAIASALDHVPGDAGQSDAGLAGHGASVPTVEYPKLRYPRSASIGILPRSRSHNGTLTLVFRVRFRDKVTARELDCRTWEQELPRATSMISSHLVRAEHSH